MAKMNTEMDELSAEDQQKAEFLVEVAYVIKAVEQQDMSIAAGYEEIIRRLGASEIERILQLIYYKK
jgi:hypothetical protein